MIQQYTCTYYGFGDPNFPAIGVYRDRSGKPVAVQIANAGRSGWVFYQPAPHVVRAAEILHTNEPAPGVHAAAFANGVIGRGFHVNSSMPGESTSTQDGARHALESVHMGLQQSGWILNGALASELREAPKAARAGFKLPFTALAFTKS